MSMKRALIYTGGKIYTDGEAGIIPERQNEDDLVICCDYGGLANAKKLGAKPSIAVGDFDSPNPDGCEIPDGCEKVQVKAEKDFTDTQLAVDVALREGVTDITVIGGLSGRLDHTLSNLGLLEACAEQGRRLILTDGQNRVRLIKDTSTIVLNLGYKYLSLLCVSEKCKGVSVEGCKYPLKNAKLKRSHQYAVSNEIDGNCALVAVRRGTLLIVESSDKEISL